MVLLQNIITELIESWSVWSKEKFTLRYQANDFGSIDMESQMMRKEYI